MDAYRLRLGSFLLGGVLLLAAACAGPSPRSPGADLVDIAAIDPSIRLDLRYATADNFTGVAVYPVARCLLRRDAAERLARVQRRLRAEGVGLVVWDCYRPLAVQERFWALVPDERYVARPVRRDGRPVAGSKHNRGAAVDVTLADASGSPLEMPTDFDDFSPRAHRGTPATPAARANAERLESAMVAEGFEPLPTEWWHFDAPGWQAYELLDVPLER
jgi:beta-N-acetylhexosaminidase/D-alanyl-D-alanine dipeptidase